MKKSVRYELAKELISAMTKPLSMNELLMMSKKDFLRLWMDYCKFREADDAMGDCEP